MLVVCLMTVSSITDATVIAGWDFSTVTSYGSSPYAATAATNTTVGGLTRGSGLGTSGTAANAAWGGAFPTSPTTVYTSLANAITAGQTQLLISATTSGSLLTDTSTNNFTITNNGSVAWNALTPFS